MDVVIVSYNSAKFLPRLLSSLKDHPNVASVTIVDNGSTDDSVAVAESVQSRIPLRVHSVRRNVGFGAAVNIGAAAGELKARQLLVINPDVAIEREVLAALSEDLERDATLAAVGTSLRTSEGQPVSSARYFPTPRSIAARRVKDVRHGGNVVEVDWLCGALMLWNRRAFEEVGGFSPEYFLYFEDVDICMKARAAGWTIAIDGRHNAIHDQGHGETTSPLLRRISRASRRRYARKWHGPLGLAAAVWADAADAAAGLYHGSRRPPK